MAKRKKSAQKFLNKIEKNPNSSYQSSPEASPVKNKKVDFSNKYYRAQSKENQNKDLTLNLDYNLHQKPSVHVHTID